MWSGQWAGPCAHIGPLTPPQPPRHALFHMGGGSPPHKLPTPRHPDAQLSLEAHALRFVCVGGQSALGVCSLADCGRVRKGEGLRLQGALFWCCT